MFPARVALLLLGLAACVAPLRAQQPDGEQRPRSIERFSGEVQLMGKDGSVQRLRVALRNWGVPNHRQIEDFPEKGLRVVELRGGDAVTVIDGIERKRAVGDFWLVPDGVRMTITTHDDFAALQVLTIESAAKE